MPETKSPLPLRQMVRHTTIIEAPRLRDALGIDVTIASETFQYTGSFKFRAAYNLALNVPQQKIVTASSGNFGQALAYACKLLGKSAIVVMPATSAKVKIDCVREFGAVADLVETREKSRAERVAELAAEHPDAYIASAFDDILDIQGNSSLAHELHESGLDFDTVIAPVGGGGLTSGLVLGFKENGHPVEVFAAEPQMANDASRSLKEGRLIFNEFEPPSVADGARTISLGNLNYEILKDGLTGIVEVPEEAIKQATRDLFLLANLKAEPTGALGIGALTVEPERFRGRKVVCVVSGGNCDPAVYAEILAGR
ncbi:MAG: pyridoxal-phosphate dependent enzyme [Fimbriimonadaceae bacterium]|nr:pyridoxal-phosphate dependent enzyme [Fimbriimonadaceae bacterium]